MGAREERGDRSGINRVDIRSRVGGRGRGGTSGRKIKGERRRGKMLREAGVSLPFPWKLSISRAGKPSPTSVELLDNSILPFHS